MPPLGSRRTPSASVSPLPRIASTGGSGRTGRSWSFGPCAETPAAPTSAASASAASVITRQAVGIRNLVILGVLVVWSALRSQGISRREARRRAAVAGAAYSVGGLLWPNWFEPQQTAAPLCNRPQECELPALIAEYMSAGALASL